MSIFLQKTLELWPICENGYMDLYAPRVPQNYIAPYPVWGSRTKQKHCLRHNIVDGFSKDQFLLLGKTAFRIPESYIKRCFQRPESFKYMALRIAWHTNKGRVWFQEQPETSLMILHKAIRWTFFQNISLESRQGTIPNYITISNDRSNNCNVDAAYDEWL